MKTLQKHILVFYELYNLDLFSDFRII